MAEVICNTSPLQYLFQLGLIDLFPKLAGQITIPPAVVQELQVGRTAGLSLPDPNTYSWIIVRPPRSAPTLPLIGDLGPGEAQVLALALESNDAIVVLDDGLARKVAQSLNMRFTGTLGILLSAKSSGLISSIEPWLSSLDALKFRLSAETKSAVLKLAGDSD